MKPVQYKLYLGLHIGKILIYVCTNLMHIFTFSFSPFFPFPSTNNKPLWDSYMRDQEDVFLDRNGHCKKTSLIPLLFCLVFHLSKLLYIILILSPLLLLFFSLSLSHTLNYVAPLHTLSLSCCLPRLTHFPFSVLFCPGCV